MSSRATVSTHTLPVTQTGGAQIGTEAFDIELGTYSTEEFIQLEDFTWNECNQDSNRLVVKNVNISPDPILRGQEMSLAFTIVVPHTITSGSAELKIWKKFGFITINLYDKKWKLSQKVQLPVEKGDDNLVFDRNVPILAPLGPYTGQLTILDQDNDKGCIDFKFNIQ